MQTYLLKKVLPLVVIFTTVVCSFFALRTNPPSWFDEGIYHQVAINLTQHGKFGVLITPDSYSQASLLSVGYPVLYPAAVSVKFLGTNILSVRLVAVLFLFGCVISFFLLSKKLYGYKTAILSTTLFVLFSPLYGNGKNLLGEVPGIFYFLSGLYLLADLEQNLKKTVYKIFLSGIFLGLAAASKPTFLIILPAIFIGCLYKYNFFIKDIKNLRKIFVLGIGILMPLSIWWVTQFGFSVEVSRVLRHYSNPYYIVDWTPIIVSNLKRFFTESTPVYFMLMFVLFLIYIIKKIHSKHALSIVDVVNFVFVCLFIIFYVRTAGWYRYFFPAHLILFLTIIPGIEAVSSSIKMFANNQKLILFCFTLLFLLQLIPFTKERWSRGIDVPTESEVIINDLKPDQKILFYSIPQVASRFKDNNKYYQYLKMSDNLALGEENLELLGSNFFDLVIAEQSLASKLPSCYNQEAVIRSIAIFRRSNTEICSKYATSDNTGN